MRIRVWWAISAIVVIGAPFFALLAHEQIATYRSDGYLPPVIAVSLATPDSARICAERPQGITDCRTVGELRKWLRERQPYDKYMK